MSEFSKRLVLARKKRKLTQQAVAQAINIGQSAYAYYEIGKTEPSIDTIKSLCNFFDCSYEEIMPELKNKRGKEDGNI